MAILFDHTPRDNAPMVRGNSFVVPASAAGKRLRVTIPIAPGLRANPGLDLQIDLFFDRGGGQSHHIAGMFVPGGPFTDKQGNVNPPPYMEGEADEFIGHTIFVRCQAPGARRYGITVEVL